MTENSINELTALYKRYSTVVKPLLAEIEAVYEKFPTSIYNEIRAVNDHVARAFVYDDAAQIGKAHSHIVRTTRDCYKCLNLYYKTEAERFDKNIQYVEPKTHNEYKLMANYGELLNNAVQLVEDAKRKEYTSADDVVCSAFQDAYIAYHELHNFILANRKMAITMKVKHSAKSIISIVLYIITFILGCVLTNNNVKILSVIHSFFTPS